MDETKEYQNRTGIRLLIVFVILSLFFVFLTGYTKYIFAKDYTFYIESPCDPSQNICFVRDCDEYCPPNGLDTYRAFEIKASLFPSCVDNACSNICLSEEINVNSQCTEINCDETTGDSCSRTENES